MRTALRAAGYSKPAESPPTQGTALADGDIVYAAAAASGSRKFKQMLGIGE